MLKIIELFAGVGSQTQALKNIGVKHEVVGIAEIDKYAISSYMQLHGETPLLGDITKIDKLPQADLWTYSFPCQDLSVAGKGLGIKVGTRSGLLFEVERLLENSIRPKYLLMENVKNLVGKKNKPDFDRWCQKLEELGYRNYWKILNAKDYGVPQNRERVFMVSILNDNKSYEFPNSEILNVNMVDMLESSPSEQFFLKKEIQDRFVEFPNNRLNNDNIEILGTTTKNPYDKNGDLIFDKCTSSWVLNPNKICNTLSARDYKQPKQIQVYDFPPKEDLCVELADVLDVDVDEKFYLSETIIKGFKSHKERHENKGTGFIWSPKDLEKDKIANCLRANASLCPTDNSIISNSNGRIRKLTPLEYWRLMGWSDEQFNKIKGISNSQLYKQAGNGIVVSVLERIFENLFK